MRFELVGCVLCWSLVATGCLLGDDDDSGRDVDAAPGDDFDASVQLPVDASIGADVTLIGNVDAGPADAAGPDAALPDAGLPDAALPPDAAIPLPDAPPPPVCGDGVVETPEVCEPGLDACCNATCDGALGPSTVCRPATGACDVAETCDGEVVDCPPDRVAPPTTTCRPATSDCDVAETCTGFTTTCPADLDASDGALCEDCPAGPGLCDECVAGACASLCGNGVVDFDVGEECDGGAGCNAQCEATVQCAVAYQSATSGVTLRTARVGTDGSFTLVDAETSFEPGAAPSPAPHDALATCRNHAYAVTLSGIRAFDIGAGGTLTVAASTALSSAHGVACDSRAGRLHALSLLTGSGDIRLSTYRINGGGALSLTSSETVSLAPFAISITSARTLVHPTTGDVWVLTRWGAPGTIVRTQMFRFEILATDEPVLAEGPVDVGGLGSLEDAAFDGDGSRLFATGISNPDCVAAWDLPADGTLPAISTFDIACYDGSLGDEFSVAVRADGQIAYTATEDRGVHGMSYDGATVSALAPINAGGARHWIEIAHRGNVVVILDETNGFLISWLPGAADPRSLARGVTVDLGGFDNFASFQIAPCL